MWLSNRDNDSIKYPNADSRAIFDFIEEVRRAPTNNGIHPFRDFSDIEAYLKKQWAGMMFTYLRGETEAKRISDLVDNIEGVSRKVERLTAVLLHNVGTIGYSITAHLEGLIHDSVLHSINVAYKASVITVQRLLTLPTLADALLDAQVRHSISGTPDGQMLTSLNGWPVPFGVRSHAAIDYLTARQAALDFLATTPYTVESYLEHRSLREQPVMESEDTNPDETHERVVARVAVLLGDEARSFDWLRTEGHVSLSDEEFHKLVEGRRDMFRLVRVIRRDSHGNRLIPGLPGIKRVKGGTPPEPAVSESTDEHSH